jgi:OOP family OmpA-OmpF porin
MVAPFLWTATLRAGVLTLGGFMPTEGARAALATDAGRIVPGATIRNLMQPAGGEIAGLDYSAVTRYALRLLAVLDSGEVRLADRGLTLEGTSADPAKAEAVRAMLHDPPAGIILDSSALSLAVEPPAAPAAPDVSASAAPPQPPPAPPGYGWTATLTGDGLTLSGAYPDEKSHREILDLARERLQGVAIKDAMRAEIGAPRRFVDGVARAFDALARLATGSARIAGTTMALRGETLLPSGPRHIKAVLADALPPGWTGEATVAPQPAPAPVSAATCQKLLRTLMTDGRIAFEKDDAAIKPEATGLLERIAVVIGRCPEATIEVAGHTDAAGSDSFNQDLSERRATAVVEYLVRDGAIPAARLKPVGFGASKPLASNDTEDGKARNRRIEFTVR